MAIAPGPVTLVGTHARLEPLDLRHAEELYIAGRDESVWTYLMRGPLTSVEDAREYIAGALAAARGGGQIPFAIIDPKSGRVVGSTRYLDIRRDDNGLEIGWTWLGLAAQRTAVNTECKLLLLSHAFDTLGCVRVQLKTDARNLRSQVAIERIGAVKEGVLRQHLRTRGGFMRNSVMYSITSAEWPAVRARLEELLSRSSFTPPSA